MVKEAIVLAGGESFRLRPETYIPKPLLPLNEKQTLLEAQVKWLLDNRFKKIVLALSEEVAEKLGGWIPLSLKVRIVVEKNHLGTSGAVVKCMDELFDSHVYVFNVDDIVWESQPKYLFEAAKEYNGASILVAKPKSLFGVLRVKQGFVRKFDEKPPTKDYCSAGHYVFSRRVVEKYFPEKGDLERLVLPKLAEKNGLRAVKYKGTWISINTYKDFLKTKEYLAEY